MEAQIHLLEQEAYTAVLRAFKAQFDAISWVPSRHATNQGFDAVPSPTFSVSRKKQKTFQSYHPSVGAPGNRSFNNRVLPGGISANESAEALNGRKVWTKWPEDNNFYEAIITHYNAAEGRHALVYDINAVNEMWEWISPEDIRWDGEENGVALNVGLGSGNGRNQSYIGRGRGPRIHQPRSEFVQPPTQQNGGGGVDRRTYSDDIELFSTDKLVKEVETVFESRNLDPFELDKPRKCSRNMNRRLLMPLQGLRILLRVKSMEIHHIRKTLQRDKDDGRAECNNTPIPWCLVSIISPRTMDLDPGKEIACLLGRWEISQGLFETGHQNV
ncbi:hypothetical protein Bca52824_025536 [Brassica carinata]|uniref:ENT domain-containing protein n=1 Tax=Brassica carinata TaxID=52824 RepID=A0A8X7SGE6_BRACI|nr:hypothetical protein Bca52824_025536 [Brassica carinata]